MHIVSGQKDGTEHLAAAEEMVDIGAGMALACGACTGLVDGPLIVEVAGVPHIDGAASSDGLAGAARAGRDDAIEHIDASLDRSDDIVGPADAHEIARPVGRKMRQRRIKDAKHLVLAFTDGEAAHGIAVEADVSQGHRGFVT